MNDCQSPAELGSHESDGGPIQSSHRPADELAFPVEGRVKGSVQNINAHFLQTKQQDLEKTKKSEYMNAAIMVMKAFILYQYENGVYLFNLQNTPANPDLLWDNFRS